MDNVATITAGISRGLHQQYPYAIYVDFRKQKGRFPCFYIKLLESTQEQEFSNRYWREHHFDIHLFMNENGEIQDNQELKATADTLFMALEYITLDDGKLLRGTDMSYRITDNVLHFFVSYNTFVMKVLEKNPVMETLGTEGGIKNGDNG